MNVSQFIKKNFFLKLFLGTSVFLSIIGLVQGESIKDLVIDHYINDYANMIDDQTQTMLEQQLSAFDTQSSHQIVVVTVNNLDNDYIEHYSIKLAEKIKAGSAKNDNGVIVLLTKQEQEIRIEVGYGLERTLTDGKSTQIIKSIIPLLKNQEYTQAITKAVTDIMLLVQEEKYTDNQNENSFGSLERIRLVMPIFVRLGSVLGRTKSRWLGGVIGAGIGLMILLLSGFFVVNILITIIISCIGFLFDYIVSRDYKKSVQRDNGVGPHRRSGGNRGPGSNPGRGGSFGGFGGRGGGFGGGGASGKW